MMNYNYLRYFSVLAEVEHYTTAAARLGISQPSLSIAIRNLEAALGGVQLFEKVGRNIRLTEEGQFYREKVNAALDELHSASLLLRDSKRSAPVVIRMGYVSGSLEGVAARKIAETTQTNNRIRFLLTESSADALLDMIRKEQLDMAIVDTTDRDRTLHFRKLKQRNLCVALREDHPLANRTELRPHDIVHEPQVVFNYSVARSFKEWTTGAPTDESVLCTVNTVQSALDLVQAGVGIAFVPQDCITERPGLRFIPLRNWHQALYLCILYDKWLEPPVWDFVEQIVRTIREEASSELTTDPAAAYDAP